MIGIARKSSAGWDSFEKDLLGQLGIEEEEEEATAPSAAGSGASASSAPADYNLTPRSGAETWGRWSHEGDGINLELALPAGARAKELTCQVSRDGTMHVQCKEEALLSGKLALPVDRTELVWVVEEQSNGSKLLCIEVPMLPIDTSVRSTTVDCIFDESLLVNGQPCMSPGLSGVAGRAERALRRLALDK